MRGGGGGIREEGLITKPTTKRVGLIRGGGGLRQLLGGLTKLSKGRLRESLLVNTKG